MTHKRVHAHARDRRSTAQPQYSQCMCTTAYSTCTTCTCTVLYITLYMYCTLVDRTLQLIAYASRTTLRTSLRSLKPKRVAQSVHGPCRVWMFVPNWSCKVTVEIPQKESRAQVCIAAVFIGKLGFLIRKNIVFDERTRVAGKCHACDLSIVSDSLFSEMMRS